MLALNGTAGIQCQGTGDSLLPHLPAGSNQPIRATRPILASDRDDPLARALASLGRTMQAANPL